MSSLSLEKVLFGGSSFGEVCLLSLIGGTVSDDLVAGECVLLASGCLLVEQTQRIISVIQRGELQLVQVDCRSACKKAMPLYLQLSNFDSAPSIID